MSILSRTFGFYRKAVTVYQVHSPAAYHFIDKVLDTGKTYYIFSTIEYIREQLLQSKERISFIELGAGSKKINGQSRNIKEIAKYSLSPVKTCRILYNTIDYYNCKNILELGSSLGISTCYISAVSQKNRVISLEGNPACADIARKNLAQLNLDHTEVRTGSFEDMLVPALNDMGKVDLVYMDGNHSYDATMSYFKTILPYLHKGSIIVLDDIYWSDGMLRAWNEIQAHTSVTFSIDIYHLGFVYFSTEMKEKQHFSIVPSWMKIWQVGLFSKIVKTR